MTRYFLALLPPQEVQAAVNQIKQHFADRYASCKAQNSPPHITLQPPFEWAIAPVSFLEQRLLVFAQRYSPSYISLSGFGAFAPRVIYIQVVKTPELLALQAELSAYLQRELKIVDAAAKKRAYAPHMTVAFRDLTQPNFRAAWSEFQHQPFQFEFSVSALTLLHHDGRRWHIHASFPFSAFVPSPAY